MPSPESSLAPQQSFPKSAENESQFNDEMSAESSLGYEPTIGSEENPRKSRVQSNVSVRACNECRHVKQKVRDS